VGRAKGGVPSPEIGAALTICPVSRLASTRRSQGGVSRSA